MMKFNVPDMSCNHCKMTIEKALTQNGFTNVEIDLESKDVTFDLNGNTAELAKQAIEAKGYEVRN